MPERFAIYIVYKRLYINTLPFLSFPLDFCGPNEACIRIQILLQEAAVLGLSVCPLQSIVSQCYTT